jgi:hypothetical protein
MTETWKWAPVSKIKAAAEELKGIIRAKHPDAEFRLSRAPDDRYIWHLWTTVDVDDPDEVNDLVRDRELDLLEQDHIPLYVITMQGKPTRRHLPNGSTKRTA